MSVSSLNQIINDKFVESLGKISKASPSSSSIIITKNLNAGDKQSLDTTLRSGARSFSLGLQALNLSISFINISRSTHEKLIRLVDRADLIVSKAAKEGLGAQSADLLQLEFNSLDRDFRKIVKDSKVQGQDVLNFDDLSSILVNGGLDPEKVDDLQTSLNEYKSLFKVEVTQSGEVNASAARLPIDEFAAAINQSSASQDDPDEEVDPASSFRTVRKSLQEIRKRLENNVDSLDKTIDVVSKNITIARAAGLALLELSDQIKGTEEADVVAQNLKDLIRHKAPTALSQAANLNSIMVAGLTLTSTTFVKK